MTDSMEGKKGVSPAPKWKWLHHGLSCFFGIYYDPDDSPSNNGRPFEPQWIRTSKKEGMKSLERLSVQNCLNRRLGCRKVESAATIRSRRHGAISPQDGAFTDSFISTIGVDFVAIGSDPHVAISYCWRGRQSRKAPNCFHLLFCSLHSGTRRDRSVSGQSQVLTIVEQMELCLSMTCRIRWIKYSGIT